MSQAHFGAVGPGNTRGSSLLTLPPRFRGAALNVLQLGVMGGWGTLQGIWPGGFETGVSLLPRKTFLPGVSVSTTGGTLGVSKPKGQRCQGALRGTSGGNSGVFKRESPRGAPKKQAENLVFPPIFQREKKSNFRGVYNYHPHWGQHQGF